MATNPSTTQQITLTQGTQFYSPQTGKAQGIVNFNTQTGKQLAPGATTTLNPVGAIPVAGLTTPTTPITPPPPSTTPTTAQTNLNTAITGAQTNNAAQANAQFQSNTGDKNYDSSFNTLIQDVINQGNQGQIKDTAYQNAGVDTLKKSYDTATTNLEQTQLANRRQVENLLGSGAGTLEQLSPQVQGLNRRAASQEADLAISQSIALRNYSTAVEIADRQVEHDLAPMKAKLEADKFIFDNVKELHTSENEQRLKKDLIQYQSTVELAQYKAKAKIDSVAASAGAVPGINGFTPASPTTYTVQATDTGGLYAIAQKNGLDFEALKAANPQLFKSPISGESNTQYAIKKGDIINLPSAFNPSPSNGSILAATGLPIQVFDYITKGQTSLTRMPIAQQNIVKAQANKFLNEKGLDYSTFQSQYEAYNKTLQKNIERNNNTKIAEDEILGTVANLSTAADEKDFGNLRIKNVAKLFAGEQVNDPTTLKYAVHLNQLRTELAFYNAAVAGNTQTTLQDFAEAERIIKNGLSSGGLTGFESAITASTKKMGEVLQRSVDSSAKSVWNLFGVANQYKSSSPVSATINTNTGPINTPASLYSSMFPGSTASSVNNAINNFVINP